MTYINYRPWEPKINTLEIIDLANDLIEDYQAQNIVVTLRALYYRFVARHPLVLDPTGLAPNTLQNYKRLGDILNKARLAGLVSWDALEDRTRNLDSQPSWTTADEFLAATPSWYHYPLWDNQPVYIEKWIEKDAGLGTIEGVCRRNDVSFFSCRGNCSQSEMHAAARRLRERYDRGQEVVVIYSGDHDPNGMDMGRDIQDRLDMFCGEGAVKVDRLLLNIDQVRLYDPPPNPVKNTDSRAKGYRRAMAAAGYDPDECWELDALDPSVVVALIEGAIDRYRDRDLWDKALEIRSEKRAEVRKLVTAALDGRR